MKKRLLIIIILTIIINVFSACYSSYDTRALKVCGSYAVPGMFYSDLKGTESLCEIVETDNYGRILFEYTAPNSISGNRDKALVICQKYDSNQVYFYEDICWLLLNDYNESDISQLKEQNDWNVPLNQSKMSRREYSVTYDLVIDINYDLEYKKVRTSCSKKLDIDSKQIRELCFVDKSQVQELYLISLIDDSKYYFALIDQEYNIELLEITNKTVNADELALFKHENGWC